MRILFIIILAMLNYNAWCQNRPIDTNAVHSWPKVMGGQLTEDGKFAAYFILNKPPGSRTLVLISTNGLWKEEFISALSFDFSSDSRVGIIRLPGDSVKIIQLGTDSAETLRCNSRLRVITKGNYLAYGLDSAGNVLALLNISNGVRFIHQNIRSFEFSPDGNKLIVDAGIVTDESNLKIIFPTNDSVVDIYKGKKAWPVIFDKMGRQFASFVGGDGTEGSTLLYYNIGMAKADTVLFPTNEKHGSINRVTGFSDDGKLIFFDTRVDCIIAKTNGVSVDIWNYKDSRLQSSQLLQYHSHPTGSSRSYLYKWSFNHWSHEFTRLGNLADFHGVAHGDFILGCHIENNAKELDEDWNPHIKKVFFLESISNAVRTDLPLPASVRTNNCWLSPGGHFVLFFDRKAQDYYSYNIQTGKVSNLTRHKTGSLTRMENHNKSSLSSIVYGIGGWIAGDSAVIIYDAADIWQIDLNGRNLPLCLTFQKRVNSNLTLRVSGNPFGNFQFNFQDNQEILLTAFNNETKKSGFFSIQTGHANMRKLCMEDYLFFDLRKIIGFPIKAMNSDGYLIERMNASESPNYFFTRDFSHMRRISDLRPEINYNWLRSELMQWKTPDGIKHQGILYKPVNFDPSVRYPVIFYYYEKLSDNLHYYMEPDFFSGPINIPWVVSRGYLVVCPDIEYESDGPGPSALRCVTSAAEYVAKFPWVDKSRFGLQGHSFGGYETDYIVTHSHMFKAAVSCAGVSDLISQYGGIGHGDSDNAYYLENGHCFAQALDRR